MSNDIAIRVTGLSKLHHLGEHAGRAPYKTLRDALSNPFRRRRGLRSPVSGPPVSSSDLWALKDVNFEINRGEVVGIIGRNGAGKSTLLKILSRITDPTEGQAELHGRVGSLLEVGTGFHPELTGRENIYLNGAILGMKHAEIGKKFDEIVAFAEVEKFIDTPVKFYSSGMYVRLAFAVAAHLEPEILLVDEVLAVGDAAFQKKCLGKMGDVAKEGRTVLFVSHNMAAIERLCPQSILLGNGTITFHGPSKDAIASYTDYTEQSLSFWKRTPPFPTTPHLLRVWLCNKDGSPCTTPDTNSEFGLNIEYSLPSYSDGLIMAAAILNDIQVPIFATTSKDCDISCPNMPGTYSTRVIFPKSLFLDKTFTVVVSLYDAHQHSDTLHSTIGFHVSDGPLLVSRLPTGRLGYLQIMCDWSPMVKID
jgi:lipopolysaccharide transport system ATP-binding protein